jgi:hypothetical protein
MKWRHHNSTMPLNVIFAVLCMILLVLATSNGIALLVNRVLRWRRRRSGTRFSGVHKRVQARRIQLASEKRIRRCARNLWLRYLGGYGPDGAGPLWRSRQHANRQAGLAASPTIQQQAEEWFV